MKEYYLDRLHWIFHYTSKNFWYCLGKTLCLIIGVPLYAVSFVIEMVLTFINMLFCWIPILNVVVLFFCKCLITVFGGTFYVCILTDLKQYRETHRDLVQYDVEDEEMPQDDASDAPVNEEQEQNPPSEQSDND